MWKASDAQSHNKKAKTKRLRAAWAKAANAALEQCGDVAKAIAAANKVIDGIVKGARTRAISGKQEGVTTETSTSTDDDNEEEEPENGNGEEDPENGNDNGDRQLDLGVDFLTRDASAGVKMEFKPNSYDPKTRTAEVLISTGARVRRMGWDGDYDEVLDMAPSAIRMTRLNSGMQFIDAHQYWRGLDSVLGAVVPGTGRIEGGKLLATLKLSRSEKGDRIAKDLSDGITVPVSVGYRTHRETIDRTTSPETRIAVDWEPYEVSYAPIPHDPGATIRAVGRPSSEVSTMTEAEKRAAAEAEAKRVADEAAAAKARADEEAAAATQRQAAEVKRIAEEAAKGAREYATEMMSIGRQANFAADVIETAIRDAVTLDDFRKQALAHLADRSKKGPNGANGGASPGAGEQTEPMIDSYGRIVVGVDLETFQRREAMAEALTIRILSSRREPAVRSQAQAEWVQRMGRTDQIVRSWKVLDGREQPQYERTKQYLGRGFVEIAAECLGYHGSIRTPTHAYELIARAFQSTSDYPAIFANVLNKTLLARYQLAMPTYREIALERQFNDFRPHPQIRAGEFPTLEALTETGEIRSGVSADSKETVSITPYGKQYPLSRQMIVNDELGAIDEILGSAGMMVLIFENKTFYTMFIGNPALVTDTTAVFHANHGNLAASGSEPSILSLGTGRAALRRMTSISGNPLNVPAAILLTGPAHETRADQMTTAFSAQFAGAINPFAGKLRNVTDAQITGNEWYLFAEPGNVPCFVYGFLAGATGPRVRTDEPFGIQGIKISLEHDFGVGAIDYRGAYKDPGAAPTDYAYSIESKTVT